MKKAYVIAVTGSGGKTTFIEQMAETMFGQGKRTAVMTTTHMRLPDRHNAVGKTPKEAAGILKREGIVYFGSYADTPGKMTFPGQEAYEALCQEADFVLVEADGSRGMPMKVPDWNREPVIPLNTDGIITVFGLSALGRPLGEVCQRWELSRAYYPGTDDTLAVSWDLASAILEKAYQKPLAFRFPQALQTILLNQADTKKRRIQAGQMQYRLNENGCDCRIVQLRPVRIAVIYLASGFGKRFGKNKLLEDINGKPMYRHSLEHFLDWQEEQAKKIRNAKKEYGGQTLTVEVIVVTQYAEIFDFCRAHNISCLDNPNAAQGITSSIHRGVKAAGNADYYLFSVADQPWLKKNTIQNFAGEFLEQSDSYSIACLCTDGQRKNPTIFHRRWRQQLLELTGDKGGSQIIRNHPDEVLEIAADEKELTDVDYPF